MSESLNSLYMRDPAAAMALRKRAMAEALMKQGTDTSPVVGTGNNTMQALARVIQGGLGGFLAGRMDAEQKDEAEKNRAGAAAWNPLAAAVNGPSPPSATAPMPDRLGGAPPAEGPAPVPPVQREPLAAPPGGQMAPSQYQPLIEAAATRNGIPPQILSAVLQNESGGNPNAVGDQGHRNGPSRGLMQIQEATARQPGYGMQPVDPAKLTDPATNINFGADYLARRGQAAGVTDWNDPAQAQRGLAAYNGSGPQAQAYGQRVAGMAGQAPPQPQAGPPPPPAPMPQQAPPVPQGLDLNALAQRVAAGMRDPNPEIRKAATIFAQTQLPVLREQAARAAQGQERAIDNARADEQLGLARQAAARDEANQPVERVRQQDGTERIVPRREAVGMASAAPAVDTFGRANALRDEYRQLTGDFRTIQTAYQNIQSAAKSNNGAGDMSLLYSYVKMLDPGSVVRESEFATAAASGSFGERVQGAAQRVLSGERMADSLRESFVNEAKNLHTTQRRTYDHLSQQYRGLAERNSLRAEDVVTDFITPEAAPAAPAHPPLPRGFTLVTQ